jgi:hypothetical protein
MNAPDLSHLETLVVEQCDREAAADLLHGGRSAINTFLAETIDSIREGQLDTHNWVQAFARHRLAALSTLREQRKALERIEAHDDRDLTESDLAQQDKQAGWASAMRLCGDIARTALEGAVL